MGFRVWAMIVDKFLSSLVRIVLLFKSHIFEDSVSLCMETEPVTW
jgi:hypothetical protein